MAEVRDVARGEDSDGEVTGSLDLSPTSPRELCWERRGRVDIPLRGCLARRSQSDLPLFSGTQIRLLARGRNLTYRCILFGLHNVFEIFN